MPEHCGGPFLPFQLRDDAVVQPREQEEWDEHGGEVADIETEHRSVEL